MGGRQPFCLYQETYNRNPVLSFLSLNKPINVLMCQVIRHLPENSLLHCHCFPPRCHLTVLSSSQSPHQEPHAGQTRISPELLSPDWTCWNSWEPRRSHKSLRCKQYIVSADNSPSHITSHVLGFSLLLLRCEGLSLKLLSNIGLTLKGIYSTLLIV